ncbi:Protein of unknown function [Pyronema omphalodes CBS 100304]|uniref:Uncharacterized protein n=1 Tax=Pyronema omphalodes (strain CBS 100304) TaxID=1076935 RepID=U4KYL8_PYROM|nr:Protein of unknown function [Pyronema omphalodes CBS 100304]
MNCMNTTEQVTVRQFSNVGPLKTPLRHITRDILSYQDLQAYEGMEKLRHMSRRVVAWWHLTAVRSWQSSSHSVTSYASQPSFCL